MSETGNIRLSGGGWRAAARAGVGAAASFVRHVALRFWNDRCFSMASSLSYTTLLAIIPFAAISLAILTAFPVFDQIRADLQTFVLKNFLPGNVETFRQQFDVFLRATRELTAIGIVALAVTAIILLDTVDTYFNKIWRQSEVRPLLARLMMWWAMLTLGPLLVGGSMGLSTFLFAKTTVSVVSGEGFVASVFLRWLPTLLLAAALAFAYVVVPYRRVRLWHAVVGAVAAALMYDVLRWGFGLYFSHFPAYQTLYGALAIIPIFLVWMYLVWSAVLIGAQIAASLPEWYALRRWGPGTDALPTRRLVAALTLLERLYASMKTGATTPGEDLLEALSAEPAALEPMLETLDRARLVTRADNEGWVLARDPSGVTVRDVAAVLDLNLVPGLGEPAALPPWLRRLDALLGRTADAERDALGVSLGDLFDSASADDADGADAATLRSAAI